MENNNEYKEIDYEEISNFYSEIYHLMSKTVSDIKYSDEALTQYPLSKEICDLYEKESLKQHGWLERGVWRLGDLDDMLDYSDEYYFFYYAMENLHNIRHRFEMYLNDTDLQFPSEVYDYTKYDDLVMDYYGSIRTVKGKQYQGLREERNKYWNHYYSLLHRKSSYGWVRNDVYDVYEDLSWLSKFVYKSSELKDFDFNLTKVHDAMEDLMYEIYHLKNKVNKKEE